MPRRMGRCRRWLGSSLVRDAPQASVVNGGILSMASLDGISPKQRKSPCLEVAMFEASAKTDKEEEKEEELYKLVTASQEPQPQPQPQPYPWRRSSLTLSSDASLLSSFEKKKHDAGGFRNALCFGVCIVFDPLSKSFVYNHHLVYHAVRAHGGGCCSFSLFYPIKPCHHHELENRRVSGGEERRQLGFSTGIPALAKIYGTAEFLRFVGGGKEETGGLARVERHSAS